MNKNTKQLGRPPKREAEKVSRSVYLRADQETADAVAEYRRRQDLTTSSEAVRQLVRKALKVEGLL